MGWLLERFARMIWSGFQRVQKMVWTEMGNMALVLKCMSIMKLADASCAKAPLFVFNHIKDIGIAARLLE
jgi:hypothetical protein